ncbi:MAG: hypothetical protein ACXW37_06250, partial [Nitrospira sp.]
PEVTLVQLSFDFYILGSATTSSRTALRIAQTSTMPTRQAKRATTTRNDEPSASSNVQWAS